MAHSVYGKEMDVLTRPCNVAYWDSCKIQCCSFNSI